MTEPKTHGSIYIITDPKESSNKCYIGQTVTTVENRLKQHIYESKRRNNKKCNWMISRLNDGHEFKIQILEWNERALLDDREKWWVDEIGKLGYILVNQLLNQSIGC